MIKAHSYHIPVMGIGFTIDTPLKVSQFGIDSVISLGDDILLEKLRKMYCNKNKLPYEEISNKANDFRARRITAYLNLIQELAKAKFEKLKTSAIEKGKGIRDYLNLLPNNSKLRTEFKRLTSDFIDLDEMRSWLNKNLSMGSIDVNIMTKLDKQNYKQKKALPIEYNDAHAALRGFAQSNLNSSIILSAGMSPRLYSYIEQFDDFFPNEKGEIKKKIVLKVSDYRSALIQGKFLAKKGLWVSEYRIESGLNCGGHAFATPGYLLGPILSEFKTKRNDLTSEVLSLLMNSLSKMERTIPKESLSLKITAQGGVGTAEEHQFLLDEYELDSVGWGTPFLLVPEAVNVDDKTLDKLLKAKEEDLYLSNVSPLGVPFNSLKGNSKDMVKATLIARGRPGSSCPKKYLALNHEFTENGICTASRQYQNLKLKELQNETIDPAQLDKATERIVEKSCLCSGLGTVALLVNDLDTKVEGEGVSVCPGPNMAYFSKKMTLKEITDHIYGRNSVISRKDRPHMFIKELNIYIDYLKNNISESKKIMTEKQKKYWLNFSDNLREGINYYQYLFADLHGTFKEALPEIFSSLNIGHKKLQELDEELKCLSNDLLAS